MPAFDAACVTRTPAYVADIPAIRRNMAVAAEIKRRTGCTLLLATKAFALPAAFEAMVDVLDGTTASGIYEAQFGHAHFGGEVHAFAPAFTQADIDALAPICSHISFNAIAQCRQWGERFAYRGLRIHAGLSQVTNNPLYDPSAPSSRFGVAIDAITPDVLPHINMLHVHNLCENNAQDSAALIEHIASRCAHLLPHVEVMNFGGGHYYSHAAYDVDALCNALNAFQREFNVKCVLEPGGAHVYDAGYLVASVLDIVQRDDTSIAIIDASATCHAPDVLEVPYRPHIQGHDDQHQHRYIIAGNTCLTGDVFGEYAFDAPLAVGQRLVFTDMLQYSIVKNSSFNGMKLPDLAIYDEQGKYDVVQQFDYSDFARKLGA